MGIHAIIRRDVPETCPEIDEVIKRVKYALRLVGKADSSSAEQMLETISGMEYELSDVEDKMENLRKANAALRELACDYLRELTALEKP